MKELGLLFLKLGSIGFGGPLALIGLMEKEVVVRRGWFSAETFKKGLTLVKLMPGPVAYQMALYIGKRQQGRWGGLLAGLAFLLPSFLMMVLISASYSQWKQISVSDAVLSGMRVGALWIILESVWRLFLGLKRNTLNIGILFFAILGAAISLSWEPLIIIGCGLLVTGYRRFSAQSRLHTILLPLFWVHFKAALLVFGTGLAVIPVLQHEIVQRYQWLPNITFLDGIGFGQLTPGPITITSVFVGHQVAGFWGAIAAVSGMYLPGILLVLFLLPLVERSMDKHVWFRTFQEGAIPAVVGCLIAAGGLFTLQTIVSSKELWTLLLLTPLFLWKERPSWIFIPIGSLIRCLIP